MVAKAQAEGGGGHGALPFEPGSASELLAATHVFAIHVDRATPAPWRTQPDGTDARDVALEATLQVVWKGALKIPPGGRYRAVIAQRRANAYFESDFRGVWSHREVAHGGEYVLFANARTDDPGVLTAEPALFALHPAAEAYADAALAVEAEGVLAGAGGAAADRLWPVLALAAGQAGSVTDIFARYFWARLKPDIAELFSELLPRLSDVLVTPGARPTFVRAMCEGVFKAALDVRMDTKTKVDLVRTLFRAADAPAGQRYGNEIVSVFIHNTLFDTQPAVTAEAVFGSEAAARRAREIVTAFGADRMPALTGWLAGR